MDCLGNLSAGEGLNIIYSKITTLVLNLKYIKQNSPSFIGPVNSLWLYTLSCKALSVDLIASFS